MSTDSPWCSPASATSGTDVNVLIVGGGGREHALAWKIAQSARVTRVYVAPGNAGTAAEPKVENVAVAAENIAGLVAFAQHNDIALTVIGPEAPLVKGVVDAFHAAGRRCFGPTAAAARLEGSKAFSKAFLARHRIPTARYATFTRDNFDADYVRGHPLPVVIKADGLAAGKGVVIADSHAGAVATVEAMFAGRYGAAGNTVVVEEFLAGEEASFIVMVDGQHVLPLASSQDHKRLLDGDQGPNTGGMGAYSPAPVVTPEVHRRILAQVIEPTVRALARDGAAYTGFLYAGVMVAPDGTPNVLEFNCRLGDPETQPILARLDSDLVELIDAALAGRLDQVQCRWDGRAAVGVVLAAAGYPESVRTGDPVAGLAAAARLPGKVFHAGTALKAGRVVSSGGRVLCAVGLADSVAQARAQAYALIDCIELAGGQFRRDIAARAVARSGAA